MKEENGGDPPCGKGEGAMIIRTLALFDRFKCAGSACKDTCCVRDKLVLDNKTYFEYQRVIARGDAFGRRMVASISERNGVASFRMRENGECPFLLRNGLCELQIRLGTDKVSETCRKYPTFSKEYGNYREIGCRFSCPEVLRLVLTHPEPFAVRERENDTEPVTFDNLNVELLEALYPVRDRFLKIAQDARNPLLVTITILLKLASEVEKAIERKAYGELATLIAPFEGDDPTGGTESEIGDPAIRDDLTARMLKLQSKLEYRKEENTVRLGKALRLHASETPEERLARERGFLAFMADRIYEYRKWLFYILHRDLLDAVRDGKFYARVRYAVITTLCLFELGSIEWKNRGNKFPPQRQEDFFRNYAREIDENEKNVAKFQKKLNGKAFALPRLLHAFAVQPGTAEAETVAPVEEN